MISIENSTQKQVGEPLKLSTRRCRRLSQCKIEPVSSWSLFSRPLSPRPLFSRLLFPKPLSSRPLFLRLLIPSQVNLELPYSRPLNPRLPLLKSLLPSQLNLKPLLPEPNLPLALPSSSLDNLFSSGIHSRQHRPCEQINSRKSATTQMLVLDSQNQDFIELVSLINDFQQK